MRNDHWSLDACVGYVCRHRFFTRDAMVCTRTLYVYVDLGLIDLMPNDLPLKFRRNPKRKHVRKRKKRLGRCITERPTSVESREEFGLWSVDTVLGIKSKEDGVLLTLTERKPTNELILPLISKSATKVLQVKRIGDYDLNDILLIEGWMNLLSKKNLGYSMPEELFDKKRD